MRKAGVLESRRHGAKTGRWTEIGLIIILAASEQTQAREAWGLRR
jgi:hypothetical protein